MGHNAIFILANFPNSILNHLYNILLFPRYQQPVVFLFLANSSVFSCISVAPWFSQ